VTSSPVRRLPVDTPLTEGRTNVYLLPDDPVSLVDSGINTADARTQLRDGLSEYGLTISDVEQVFLTHYHADHGGLAGWIQSKSDAAVFAHESDADRVDPSPAQWLDICNSQYERLETWGTPRSKLSELRAVNDENHRFHSDSVEIDPLRDGDVVAAGEAGLTVIHTPGHTAGSCCYQVDDKVFTGDTLLPVYTPNIGGADMRLSDPIGTYLQSLRLLAESRYAHAYPGHRDSITQPTDRISEIGSHHLSQAHLLLEAMEKRESSADLWTLTQELYVDVEDIHVVLGVGETHAHLRHLETLGLVDLADDGAARTTIDRAADIVDERWPV